MICKLMPQEFNHGNACELVGDESCAPNADESLRIDTTDTEDDLEQARRLA